jgi:hypothetical protein
MQMPATTGYPVSYQPQYEQMTDRALLLLLLLLAPTGLSSSSSSS